MDCRPRIAVRDPVTKIWCSRCRRCLSWQGRKRRRRPKRPVRQSARLERCILFIPDAFQVRETWRPVGRVLAARPVRWRKLHSHRNTQCEEMKTCSECPNRDPPNSAAPGMSEHLGCWRHWMKQADHLARRRGVTKPAASRLFRERSIIAPRHERTGAHCVNPKGRTGRRRRCRGTARPARDMRKSRAGSAVIGR